jgi:hypothetical protein
MIKMKAPMTKPAAMGAPTCPISVKISMNLPETYLAFQRTLKLV